MSVCFPTAISQIELDRATHRLTGIDPDDGIRKIRTGCAVPGAELNDRHVIAGYGTESATEISSEPAGLQFQFAWDALCGKEGAFVDTRRIAEVSVTFGRLHVRGEMQSRFWRVRGVLAIRIFAGFVIVLILALEQKRTEFLQEATEVKGQGEAIFNRPPNQWRSPSFSLDVES